MYSMPETPRWSLGKNRRGEALRALQWLRGADADVEEECYTIEATLGNHSLSSLTSVVITYNYSLIVFIMLLLEWILQNQAWTPYVLYTTEISFQTVKKFKKSY